MQFPTTTLLVAGLALISQTSACGQPAIGKMVRTTAPSKCPPRNTLNQNCAGMLAMCTPGGIKPMIGTIGTVIHKRDEVMAAARALKWRA